MIQKHDASMSFSNFVSVGCRAWKERKADFKGSSLNFPDVVSHKSVSEQVYTVLPINSLANMYVSLFLPLISSV